MSSPPPSPHNPSQAVERIREIIVGRHLEKLELRVVRLEAAAASGPMPTAWEDRLCTNEARVEALQENFRRLADSTREDAEQRSLAQRAEIQRLAAQIQQAAAAKASEANQPAIDRLEHKIGSWLTNWQASLHAHLNEREHRLSTQIRQEMASLWESTEAQITRLQSRMVDKNEIEERLTRLQSHSIDVNEIEERFSRITAAALALAECAAPLHPRFGAEKPTS